MPVAIGLSSIDFQTISKELLKLYNKKKGRHISFKDVANIIDQIHSINLRVIVKRFTWYGLVWTDGKYPEVLDENAILLNEVIRILKNIHVLIEFRSKLQYTLSTTLSTSKTVTHLPLYAVRDSQ